MATRLDLGSDPHGEGVDTSAHLLHRLGKPREPFVIDHRHVGTEHVADCAIRQRQLHERIVAIDCCEPVRPHDLDVQHVHAQHHRMGVSRSCPSTGGFDTSVV